MEDSKFLKVQNLRKMFNVEKLYNFRVIGNGTTFDSKRILMEITKQKDKVLFVCPSESSLYNIF